MMASVAKNADAACLLLSELNANASYGNANGMTALMCAARLGDPSAPNAEPLAAASEAIVRLLLTSGVHVNATETAAGNSALHFAVLSHNARGVAALTESQVDADVSLRNTAGLSPIDLAKRVGVPADTMECLKRKLAAMESVAAARCAALESELLGDAKKVAGAERASKNKKSKGKVKKAAASDRSVKGPVSASVELEADVDPVNGGVESETSDESRSRAGVEAPVSLNWAESAMAELAGDEDWQEVAAKKSRELCRSLDAERVGSGVSVAHECCLSAARQEAIDWREEKEERGGVG